MRPHFVLRTGLMAGIAATYVAVVFGHDQPLAFAVGLAPMALIALEGCWRLFEPHDEGEAS